MLFLRIICVKSCNFSTAGLVASVKSRSSSDSKTKPLFFNTLLPNHRPGYQQQLQKYIPCRFYFFLFLSVPFFKYYPSRLWYSPLLLKNLLLVRENLFQQITRPASIDDEIWIYLLHHPDLVQNL